MAEVSAVRQNYHGECEAAINKTINHQLTSSYSYLAMAFHFDRADVALKGFQNYFEAMSDSKRSHAMMLLKYQNERGGRIKLSDVSQPCKDDWGTGQEAMTRSLEAEKASNQGYLDLYNLAEKYGDEQLGDFVEDNFLASQTELIKTIGDHISNLSKVGAGLGEYQFDHHLGKK
ncbi:soma ferritin [Strongylocentrotus purpuratus]|uniref:Ferritin n=1 Tax=Strongylocentrotus purpuratus TaxID=7668 RepID=A0A7M7REL7_STRPU|nr:soma ferritin [Strongylocentrotus purpuratus]